MTIPPEYLMLAALAPAGFLLGWVISQFIRRRRDGSRQKSAAASRAQIEFAAAAEQAVGDIRHSVTGLAGVVRGTEKRLADLERHFQMLESSASRVGRRQGFAEAIALARDGASPDEIAGQCGVSPAEAALLAQVHVGRNTH